MKKTTEQLASEALQHVINVCQKKKGAHTEIANRLTALTGVRQYRQNVDGWLHPDPKLRVEPRLGMGLAILLVTADYWAPFTVRGGVYDITVQWAGPFDSAGYLPKKRGPGHRTGRPVMQM
jgi:hypothetical protein